MPFDQATAIRDKHRAEFNEDTVLAKHNSFLQMPGIHLAGVADTVQYVMQKHSELLKGILTHKERRMVASFFQAPMTSLTRSQRSSSRPRHSPGKYSVSRYR